MDPGLPLHCKEKVRWRGKQKGEKRIRGKRMGSNGKHWGVMKRKEERKERKKGKRNKERRAGRRGKVNKWKY